MKKHEKNNEKQRKNNEKTTKKKRKKNRPRQQAKVEKKEAPKGKCAPRVTPPRPARSGLRPRLTGVCPGPRRKEIGLTH
jgi:hypothetical protein